MTDALLRQAPVRVGRRRHAEDRTGQDRRRQAIAGIRNTHPSARRPMEDPCESSCGRQRVRLPRLTARPCRRVPLRETWPSFRTR
eukprot:scaffold1167_cov418-Prasinococcus_capsulatus_cf.AAC.31